MSNHLIIGLGGTGGKIIRAFRKTLFQEFRDSEIPGVSVRYIYVDSSTALMTDNDPSWKILGTNVQLGKDSQVPIGGADLNQHLKEIDKFPGIKPWIGNRDYWAEILNALIDDAAGGQKRRLGRFLFACNASMFLQVLNNQVKKLVDESHLSNVTFHICCGLAGGTGSGTLIDVISQIRDRYPPSIKETPYKIVLYVMLPDANPPFGWDTGNYHANGYAALMELNALSVGSFQPCDITGVKDRFQHLNPFNGCYLFTKNNENGLEVNVDTELPSIIADFLYVKIVSVRDNSWEDLSRLENAENGDGSPEAGERSKRFLTFGIKRLTFPEEEIKEFLTYNYAIQSCHQLRFNNWNDQFGFVDEAKNQDFNELVRKKDVQFNWAMSDEHLTQSLGILPEDARSRRWKAIQNLWETILPNFVELARTASAQNWLSELGKLCEKQYQEDYRGTGVVNFYAAKVQAKKEITREVRKRVETQVFDEWRNGVKSLYDISRLMEALLRHTDERLREFDDRIIKLKGLEENFTQQLTSNLIEWSKLGLFKKILGKRDNLLNSHTVLLQQVYTIRTSLQGLAFAKTLTQELIPELSDLKSEIDKAASTVSEAVKKFGLLANERCKDGNRPDLKNHIVRFYDPELVRRVSSRFVRNDQEQKAQTSTVRSELVKKIGDNPSFLKFNERVSIGTFLDTLEMVCEENARTAHNTLIENLNEKLLGVSIIEKLKQRFESNDEELKDYIYQLVKHAGNYVSFDDLEISKRGAGIPDAVGMFSSFTVILPKAPAYTDFVTRLKRLFSESTKTPVGFVESEHKPNEITLVSLRNLFPLRFVTQVGFLKGKYKQRLGLLDAEKAKLVLHLEGDGTQHPRLFVLTSEESRELREKAKTEAVPYLLLAKIMNQITELEDPATGVKQFVLVRKKSYGVDDVPIVLGQSFSGCLDMDWGEWLDPLKSGVANALAGEFLHIEKRKELQSLLLVELNRIKEEKQGNILDPIYRKFSEGASVAIEQLLGLFK